MHIICPGRDFQLKSQWKNITHRKAWTCIPKRQGLSIAGVTEHCARGTQDVVDGLELANFFKALEMIPPPPAWVCLTVKGNFLEKHSSKKEIFKLNT